MNLELTVRLVLCPSVSCDVEDLPRISRANQLRSGFAVSTLFVPPELVEEHWRDLLVVLFRQGLSKTASAGPLEPDLVARTHEKAVDAADMDFCRQKA